MRTLLASVPRGAFFVVVWIALTDGDVPALPVGVAAAAAAAWISLRLLPPGPAPRPVGLAACVLRFLALSLVNSLTVARLALSPRPRLKPGILEVPVALPPGMARSTLAGELSLRPGTLVVGRRPGSLLVHVLDLGQPAEHGVARSERALMRALGRTPEVPAGSPSGSARVAG